MNFSKTRASYILGIALLLLAVLVGIFTLRFWERRNSGFDGNSKYEMAGVTVYDGVKYVQRGDVETILIIGIDKFDNSGLGDDSYINDSCADFLTLIVIDKTNDKVSTVYINRNTITDITAIGIGGKEIGTFKGQVALSHTYGSGLQDSCRYTVKAVSSALNGIKIDRYVSLTMDAVGKINDMVGGVTLTVMDDLSSIDPLLVKGETVTLDADSALNYVRSRQGLDDPSNEARMERQKQYIEALTEALRSKIDNDDEFSAELISDLSKYMVTNCTSGQLERISNNVYEFASGGSYTPEGELRVTEYAEFYPDYDSVMEILIEVVYKPVK